MLTPLQPFTDVEDEKCPISDRLEFTFRKRGKWKGFAVSLIAFRRRRARQVDRHGHLGTQIGLDRFLMRRPLVVLVRGLQRHAPDQHTRHQR